MGRNNLYILASMLLLLSGRAGAQQEAAMADRVLVLGSVVDHLSGEPQPYCLLQFVNGQDTVAAVRCDSEGYFVTDPMPTGSYSLSVTLKGQVVYRSDLVLNDNAALHIAVITDTFTFRKLRPIDVKSRKRQPGMVLISSADDVRLWDLSGRMDGNASASVDLSGSPNLGFTLVCPGLTVSSKNSTMKNELLLYGRILDTRCPRPAPADSTNSKGSE